MLIIKAFFLTAKKHIISVLIYLSVFLFLLILFSKNGNTQTDTFENTKLNIIIQDQDHSQASEELTGYLADQHNILEGNYTEDELTAELYYENADYILTIPEGFQENLLQGETESILKSRKRQNTHAGYFADMQLQQYLSLATSYLSAGYSLTDASQSVRQALEQEVDIQFPSQDLAWDNSLLYNSFCWMPYVLTCILASAVGIILMTFQQDHIRTRLQCSSLSPIRRNFHLILGSGILALVCWAALIIVNALIMSLDLFSLQGRLYIANSLVFLLVGLSITFLLSLLAHSVNMLSITSNVIGLGISFLGGVYVPLEYMDPTIVSFSRFLPSYWYVIAMQRIDDYIGGTVKLQSVLSALGVELLFAVAIFSIALVISQTKKDNASALS